MISRHVLTSFTALFFLFNTSTLHADSQRTRPGTVPAGQMEAVMEGMGLRGSVLETMNSAGYTYLHLETAQGRVWVAILEDSVQKGQEVIVAPGMIMRNFESNTLGRTFETILFSSGLDREAMAQSTTPVAPADNEPQHMFSFAEALQAERSGGAPVTGPPVGEDALMGDSPGSAGAIVPAKNVKVEKASGDNSFTVEELFAQAAALHGTTVRVRGKVVKISRMIMGKNWVHIQDGSGNPLHNHHNLVFTTLDDPGEGAIVTVEGILKANRDFGAGYRYEAIIEDASVER
ncbi:DNA-binding protein [Desulfobulbus alkaliphilus]|uniref:DNA-binding protein n=1 Tax=Desulfobulbus alkaliphilus TaxID=869814 RepID=UPI001964446E|nr:DNA-binding protein [Desulfobulbus alkaliphilus]MBM9536892.1 DNA-binding protein [Desulfobulbus alkaliphilus]